MKNDDNLGQVFWLKIIRTWGYETELQNTGIFFKNFLPGDRFFLIIIIIKQILPANTVKYTNNQSGPQMHTFGQWIQYSRRNLPKLKYNGINKIVKANNNWAVPKWQTLCWALYLHSVPRIPTMILWVRFDSFPILHMSKSFKG